MAKAQSVYVALDRLLSDFSKEENEVLFKCMSKAMRMAKQDVQNITPPEKRSGDYARGWAIRTKRLKYGFQGVIYNKDKPGLTHLLENGKLVNNGTGRVVGEANPHEHIATARNNAEAYLTELLVENL